MDAQTIQAISKRRGFIWASAEIYGGMAGFYDYGHLGASMKRKWEDAWLKYFLGLHDNYCYIDTTNIMPYAALKASGHVDMFTDVLVECGKCGQSFRADQLIEDQTGEAAEDLGPKEIDAKLSELALPCPKCKEPRWGEARHFNMMFPVQVGPKGEEQAFLRPETAQGPYLNFKREFNANRESLPLGLALIGRAFRNEISPRQGVYRVRELIQAELQIFMDPETFADELDLASIMDYELQMAFVENREKDNNGITALTAKDLIDGKGLPGFYVYHMVKIQQFYLDWMQVPRDKFRFYEKSEKERAFYNRVHFDIEADLESLGGFKELAGLHYRGDYDLGKHQEGSKEKMEVSIDGKKVLPHVLELSFGVDRNLWAMLDIHMHKEGEGKDERALISLPARIAPFQVAVFPLVKKDGIKELARELYEELSSEFDAFWDIGGSIGRRYARMDEIGTPYCITVDYDTKEKGTITIRERDTTKQKTVPREKAFHTLIDLIKKGKKFDDI